MNTYKSLVRLVVTQKVTTTTNVVVQAQDAYKAKLQLEAMYGKGNVVSYPQLVRQLFVLSQDKLIESSVQLLDGTNKKYYQVSRYATLDQWSVKTIDAQAS